MSQLQQAVDHVVKDLELERCKHMLIKRTCSLCMAPQIAAKQQEHRVETRSLARTEKCRELIGSLDFDVFTLGFLAARGYLRFAMAQKDVDRFERDYLKLAGVAPEEHGGPQIVPVSPAGNEHWAISGSIEFRLEPEDEGHVDFGEFQLYETQEGRYGIANTAFAWVLVALGFRLGRQDIERIKLRLERDVDQFEAGVIRGSRKPQ